MAILVVEGLPTHVMTDPKPTLAQVVKAGLRRPPARGSNHKPSGEPALKRELQALQIDLLRADYQDFTRLPRYRSLVDFFFSALYAPRDFADRNESFRSLHSWLIDLIGRDPVRLLAHAIELNDLTESLDDDMVLALRTAGIAESITLPDWEAAYRLVDRRSDRQRQVTLLLELGAVLGTVARLPLVNLQLRAVRPATVLIGWSSVIDFLLAGQEAMAAAWPIEPLLNAIRERETRRIDRLLPLRELLPGIEHDSPGREPA